MAQPETDAIHIRLATPADLGVIVKGVNAAFAIETFLDGQRTDQEHVLEMMKQGNFLVAEDVSGRLSAVVYVELRASCGYFGMLSDPSRQKTGIGRAMVQAAEKHCLQHGCKRMEITVLSLRPELLPCYRKFGYKETGIEEFHPSRPLIQGVECHCIVMSKLL